jgi:hypothetical protein
MHITIIQMDSKGSNMKFRNTKKPPNSDCSGPKPGKKRNNFRSLRLARPETRTNLIQFGKLKISRKTYFRLNT